MVTDWLRNFGLGFLISASLIAILMPLFRAYALARPNARSSHRHPVPQGGGIGILGATLMATTVFAGGSVPGTTALAIASFLIGVLGAWDDLKPLGWRPRLLVQLALIGFVLASMPSEWRLFPAIPLPFERILAAILGLWFVNLTNFMDGIDGILVVGLAPPLLLVGTGFFGQIDGQGSALALAGAMLGFLLFNTPPARLMAGDVGSLSIGLMAAHAFFVLAVQYSLVAAIILPLYFVADATSTLMMRAWRREKLTEGHRLHAYQHAYDAGLPPWRILGEILALNLGLGLLAAIAIRFPSAGMPALITAFLATGGLLLRQRNAK
jgi:UDP-N-acetylmuramyl pentapeptide phosphotransferase/UDP-N-acetylglucosamine-1-phosphate transferase